MKRDAWVVLTAVARWVVVAVAAVAIGVLTVMLAMGHVPGDDWWPGPALAVASIAVVVAGVLDATTRVSRRRRRAGRAPVRVLSTFGERIGQGAPLDDLLADLAESVRFATRAGRIEIWTATDQPLEYEQLAAAPGAPDDRTVVLAADEHRALARVGVAGSAWLQTWGPELGQHLGAHVERIAPAHHGGDVLGWVVVVASGANRSLGVRDDQTLGEVAERLGDVLRHRQLDSALRTTLRELRRANVELRASRSRLVAVADDERRRFERDLHDGAQQQLVGLTMALGAARDATASEAPSAIAARLEHLVDEASDIVRQLREVSHGIYPPLLMQSGLPGALRSAARRSTGGVSVHVDEAIDHHGRMARDVETAIYFCCLEAMQNAAKHAPAAGLQLTISMTADADGATAVQFVAADNGPGFSPVQPAPGQGLQNMTDRVGAVGGTLHVDTGPEGTRIVGIIPLGARPDGADQNVSSR